MKIILGLLLVFCATSMAQARLGETPDQVAARFGKSVSENSITEPGPLVGLKQQNFKKQGFDIAVLFTDVSVGETYDASSKLTDSQIQALLAANSEGHQWKKDSARSLSWIRDDGATAQLIMMVKIEALKGGIPKQMSTNKFVFKSKFLVDKEEAWKTAQLPKPPSVEGF